MLRYCYVYTFTQPQGERKIAMPLKNTYKDFYTASQAMKALGVTEGMFYNFIRNGDLQGTTLPGRKQSLYSKQAVEQLATELRLLIGTRNHIKSTFLPMKEEDLLECTKISDMIFGGHIDIERQKMWLKRNPEIGYVVKDDDKVVGYLIILPLKLEKIEKLLTEEEHSVNIEALEVETFDTEKTFYLYGTAIGILPGLTLAEKRAYGAKLVGGFVKALINMGKRGILIDTIIARSTKPDGIRLLRDLGFTQILSTTEKKNFILKIEISGAKEAMLYKQALQESERWTPQPFNLLNEVNKSML